MTPGKKTGTKYRGLSPHKITPCRPYSCREPERPAARLQTESLGRSPGYDCQRLKRKWLITLSRRNVFRASAATIATGLSCNCDAVENDELVDWAPVHVNLAYLKSQQEQIVSVMPDVELLFPRRIPIALENFNGLPRAMFFIEITGECLESKASWSLIKSVGGHSCSQLTRSSCWPH